MKHSDILNRIYNFAILERGNFSAVAFSAARTTSQTIGDDLQVMFTTQLVNDGNCFNLTSSAFIPPYSGFYWLHYSIGIVSLGQAEAYMSGTERMSNAMRSVNTNSGEDIISRDEIFNLEIQCGKVKIWSDYNVFSDSYMQTSFSGFSIESLSDTYPVVFSIALTSKFTCPISTKIPYNRVLIDTHSGWRPTEREYVAPVSGTYVIALIAGADQSYKFGLGLYSYGAVMTSIQIGSSDHKYESLGKTVVTELIAGDRIYASCYFYSTSYLYSELRAQTLLTGFLYAPRSFSSFSWSVAAVVSMTGPQYPVSFPVELIDIGNGWDRATNTYTVKQTGSYYISMTAGVDSAQRTNMQLQINDDAAIANVYMYSTDHNGIKTRSRAILVRLNAGDTLRVNLPSGYYLYSNDNRITSFTGFCVSA